MSGTMTKIIVLIVQHKNKGSLMFVVTILPTDVPHNNIIVAINKNLFIFTKVINGLYNP